MVVVGKTEKSRNFSREPSRDNFLCKSLKGKFVLEKSCKNYIHLKFPSKDTFSGKLFHGMHEPEGPCMMLKSIPFLLTGLIFQNGNVLYCFLKIRFHEANMNKPGPARVGAIPKAQK